MKTKPKITKPKQEQIKLGDVVRDRITGFAGVAIGITDWLYGCRRIIIQPKSLYEGKPVATESFDVQGVELLVDNKLETAPLSGGPMPTPTRY